MSDFIVSLNKKYSGKCLLELLKRPYGKRSPEGNFYDFPWGSLAILQEKFADNQNMYSKNNAVFCWIGDLVMDLSGETIERIIKRISDVSNGDRNSHISLEHDEIFGLLNGAFAIVFADPKGIFIITDPMNFTPVYAGADEHDIMTSFGTHPDLVACISSDSVQIDDVSAVEFLSSGHCSFPNTIHRNVKEMKPGRLHSILFDNSKAFLRDAIYWLPPREIHENYDEDVLADELRNALISAVRDRCDTKKVAVLLSGGLDSRLIMAAVPDHVECAGVTFTGECNRESRTAQKIAQYYNRDWHLLIREKELLGNNIEDIVKLTGCEFEWFHAHTFGFTNDISTYNVNTLLNGVLFDGYFKAYHAHDIATVKRMKGLLPDTYRKQNYDYTDIKSDLWKTNIHETVLQRFIDRRRCYLKDNIDKNRTSIAESLILYPFSQNAIGALWSAERRVLPIRIPAMDRRLLDFAFRCPMELKLGKKIFLKAAKKIYGPGARIRDANDGVRPGSNHVSRLAQRAIRKSQFRITRILKKMGREPKIQHSWQDHQKYWRDSEKLHEIISKYGTNLNQFDGLLFKASGRALLERKDINWRDGFRLLQLAIWREGIEEYRKMQRVRA